MYNPFSKPWVAVKSVVSDETTFHANWLATKVPLFLFFVIINFIKQFADKHRIRLVSQLSRRIKRVLQKIIYSFRHGMCDVEEEEIFNRIISF